MFPSVFYRELKIFTGNATITNVFTDGTIPSVFYQELRNIYCKCHNHRCFHRRIHSIDISLRVEKYLLHMPLSPTEYFRLYISSGNFFDTHFLSVKPFVFFFIDRMWNYWRKLSWQTHSVEDLVGKTFTDEVVISHQRIWSVGKTVKCCSGCLVEVGMLCAYHWNTTTHPYIFGQCYKHTITQFLSSLSIALASNHK